MEINILADRLSGVQTRRGDKRAARFISPFLTTPCWIFNVAFKFSISLILLLALKIETALKCLKKTDYQMEAEQQTLWSREILYPIQLELISRIDVRIDVALFVHYVMEIIMIRVVYSISTAAAASETNGFIFFRLLWRGYASQQETAKQLHHERIRESVGGRPHSLVSLLTSQSLC